MCSLVQADAVRLHDSNWRLDDAAQHFHASPWPVVLLHRAPNKYYCGPYGLLEIRGPISSDLPRWLLSNSITARHLCLSSSPKAEMQAMPVSCPCSDCVLPGHPFLEISLQEHGLAFWLYFHNVRPFHCETHRLYLLYGSVTMILSSTLVYFGEGDHSYALFEGRIYAMTYGADLSTIQSFMDRLMGWHYYIRLTAHLVCKLWHSIALMAKLGFWVQR